MSGELGHEPAFWGSRKGWILGQGKEAEEEKPNMGRARKGREGKGSQNWRGIERKIKGERVKEGSREK